MFDPIRRFVADHIGVFSWLTIGILLLSIALVVFGLGRKGPLTTGETPRGIVDLELADRTRAQEIVSIWKSRNLLPAAFESIRKDWSFILIYVTVLLIGLLTVGVRGPGLVSRTAAVLALLTVLAGVLDAVENLGMQRQLRAAEAGRPVGTTVAIYAWPKFAIVAVVWLFIAVRMAVALAGLLRGRR